MPSPAATSSTSTTGCDTGSVTGSSTGLRCGVAALGLALLTGVLGAPAGAVPAAEPVVVAAVTGTPWEIVPLPTGGSLVVQRDGGIVRLDADDHLVSTPAMQREAIPSVRKLLGLALAPDFAASGLAYLYVSQSIDPDGGGPMTAADSIWRLRAEGTTLRVVDEVFAGIESDGNHDGGRMVFGPDGHLYVTTGDVHQPTRPQDLQSLNGKILRLAVPAAGRLTVPADNPFVARGGNARWVWSSGHRHPQGLAFTPDGRLWETEHGPSGEQYADHPGGNGRTGRDELNLIVRGGNYGWPEVSGTDVAAGMLSPAAVAGPTAWAPGDLAAGADGSLYAPFLAGQRLHRFDVRDGVVVGEADHLVGAGRLRVAVARGGDLLVASDGSPASIRRIPLTSLPAPAPPVLPAIPAIPATPATPATPPTAAAPASAGREQAHALARALARDATRPRALTRLVAGRPVSTDRGAPSPGRCSLQVRLGRGPGAPLLARARSTGGAGLLRLRLDRRDRAALQSSGARGLTVRARCTLAVGGPAEVTRTVRPGLVAP